MKQNKIKIAWRLNHSDPYFLGGKNPDFKDGDRVKEIKKRKL